MKNLNSNRRHVRLRFICQSHHWDIHTKVERWGDSLLHQPHAKTGLRDTYTYILFFILQKRARLLITLACGPLVLIHQGHLGNRPDSKVHEANMGPTWFLSIPDGTYVGLMIFAIRDVFNSTTLFQQWGALIVPLLFLWTSCGTNDRVVGSGYHDDHVTLL